MGTAKPGAACRTFEEALASFDLDGGVPPLGTDSHAASCPSCAALVEMLRANAALFAALLTPTPDLRLLRRLRQGPDDFFERREASEVVALLDGGALAAPVPPEGFMGKLVFIPGRAKAAAATSRAESRRGILRRMFGDWRITVATVYGVALLVVTLLRVDPTSLARSTAHDLTNAGERAIADARIAAVQRIQDSAFGRAAAPLTSRLDYRVYRTFAAGKARAVAYSQLLFEKVFGATMSAGNETRERRPGSGKEPEEPREPEGRSFRS
jgi:hypothetical protein